MTRCLPPPSFVQVVASLNVGLGVGLAATLCPKWTFTIKKQYASRRTHRSGLLLFRGWRLAAFTRAPTQEKGHTSTLVVSLLISMRFPGDFFNFRILGKRVAFPVTL